MRATASDYMRMRKVTHRRRNAGGRPVRIAGGPLIMAALRAQAPCRLSAASDRARLCRPAHTCGRSAASESLGLLDARRQTGRGPGAQVEDVSRRSRPRRYRWTGIRPGDFGGLKLTPAAEAAAKSWKQDDDMTISATCRVPSIVYAMQGPFPDRDLPGHRADRDASGIFRHGARHLHRWPHAHACRARR